MELQFDTSLAKGYTSNSQIARVLTENWVKTQSYCPCCGNLPISEFHNNRPVADFYCNACNEEFEEKLKLKYPNNNFIKDKIRQQLQLLRDKGIIEFAGRGNYKKI